MEVEEVVTGINGNGQKNTIKNGKKNVSLATCLKLSVSFEKEKEHYIIWVPVMLVSSHLLSPSHYTAMLVRQALF